MKSIIICAGWVLFNLIIQLTIQLGMSVFAVHQGMDEDFIVMQWIMNNMLLMTLISNILFIAAAVLFHKIRKVFGLIHIPAGGFSLAAAAAVIGIILGTVYVRTGSLYAAFAAHLAANLPDFIFKLFPWMNHILKYALAGVFSLLFAGCMLLWMRKDETTE